jgi:hypothetical protein
VENLIPDVPKPTINLKRKLDEFLLEWISTRRIIKRVGSTNQRGHCYSINLLL